MTHNGFLTDGPTWDREGARTAGTQELTITSGRIRGFNAAGEEIRGEMPKGTGDRENVSLNCADAGKVMPENCGAMCIFFFLTVKSQKVEDGQTKSPKVEDGQTKSPKVEDGQTKSPKVEDGQTKSPKVEDGQTKSRVKKWIHLFQTKIPHIV
ncbi:hypothetical protein BgiMline_008537 [Biomphalaria glabrata]